MENSLMCADFSPKQCLSCLGDCCVVMSPRPTISASLVLNYRSGSPLCLQQLDAHFIVPPLSGCLLHLRQHSALTSRLWILGSEVNKGLRSPRRQSSSPQDSHTHTYTLSEEIKQLLSPKLSRSFSSEQILFTGLQLKITEAADGPELKDVRLHRFQMHTGKQHKCPLFFWFTASCLVERITVSLSLKVNIKL